MIHLTIQLDSGATMEISMEVNAGPRIPAPMERDEIREPSVAEFFEGIDKLKARQFTIVKSHN